MGVSKILWRSTKLKEVEDYCLAALCFEGAPRDRRVFEAGKTAHYLNEQAQLATNAKGASLDLLEIEDICEKAQAKACEEGFVWEGVPEPPPRIDAAITGRRFAENWLKKYPPEVGFEAERAVTLDRWGRIVDKDSPDAWMRVLIDSIGITDMQLQDSWIRVLAIRDGKTDWQSGSRKGEDGSAADLDRAQARIQALAGWALNIDEQFSAIEISIDSMRRQWRYSRLISFEEMGVLDVWRQELLAITDAFDRRIAKRGLTPEALASPGAACLGCPHRGYCPAGRDYLVFGESWQKKQTKRMVIYENPELTPEEAALRYALHKAEADRLRGYLVPICKQTGVVISGSTEVGYAEKPETVVEPNAAEIVWRVWKRQHREGVEDAQDAFERDLLQTYLDGLRLGVTELTKLLSKLWPLNKGKKPERDAKRVLRDEIWAEATKQRVRPVFDIRKIPEPNPEPAEELERDGDGAVAVPKIGLCRGCAVAVSADAKVCGRCGSDDPFTEADPAAVGQAVAEADRAADEDPEKVILQAKEAIRE